ncbi:phenylacetate-CoA ligase [Aminomonas paucivorans DSM 12260]|uniref:Phenylacetate-coenzyme A ligase n=1 Tax=Aminomonas paucivorans DSM 12260 TaxID=584708 RepID=E3CVF1_9BACT|nr:phenylacetate--CoA ligase [Aminomonas paucivorans]EFQ23207.1 phenylacetate-CoA ligase [Aminomonas paucivorans DSM 12260]
MNTNRTPNQTATALERTRQRLRLLEERDHPYARKVRDAGLSWRDLDSLEALSAFPFTTKQDLQEHYPLGWLGCDRADLVRFHATSGTTGNPTVVAYTASDLDAWSGYMAWCLHLAGVRREDTVQVAYGYGLFTGGLGLHGGAERLGASVVPASGGFSERQIKLMKDLDVTVLACTPSYALKLAETWEESGGGPTPLRVGIFGAEPWSEGLRRQIEDRLGITALDVYGLSEAMGPGVAMECPHQNGLHLHPDSFLAEVIDPVTGRPVAPGEMGELVLTSLHKEAFPVIRYRTRDLTRLLTAPCPCGTEGPRIERIQGRSDDMLILRGVNVFPSQVEAALLSVEGLSGNYQMEVWTHEGMQNLVVRCERMPEVPDAASDALARRASKRLQERLGIRIDFEPLSPGKLPRFEGKAKRVVQAPAPAITR